MVSAESVCAAWTVGQSAAQPRVSCCVAGCSARAPPRRRVAIGQLTRGFYQLASGATQESYLCVAHAAAGAHCASRCAPSAAAGQFELTLSLYTCSVCALQMQTLGEPCLRHALLSKGLLYATSCAHAAVVNDDLESAVAAGHFKVRPGAVWRSCVFADRCPMAGNALHLQGLLCRESDGACSG